MATSLKAQHVTDLVTSDGELFRVVQQRDPARTYQRGRFVIVFTEALARAAKEIKQGMTLRVLYLLPEHLSFIDFRPLPVRVVGEALGTNPGNISRSMQQLLAIGIVEREGHGARTTWRLTTYFGWVGSVDQYHAFRGGRLKGKTPPQPVKVSSRIMHKEESGAETKDQKPGTKLSESKQTRLTLLRVERTRT